MLTSLDFLEVGQKFPPDSERERLTIYEENKKLFEGDHSKVFEGLFRIFREENGTAIKIVLNWYKRLSNLWADLLLGEPPRFSAASEDYKELLHDIITKNNLLKTAYEVAIDMSRYGVGIFKVRYDGRPIIESVPPSLWYPVVEPDNIKEVKAHVLAWTFDVPAPTRLNPDAVIKYLRAEVHERGKISHLLFRLKDGKIESNIGIDAIRPDVPEVEETGINDFLIIPAINSDTSDNIYGYDDYQSIDPIIQEIEVRLSQISKILDRHSDPHMYGPITALEKDQYGEYIFRAQGKYFPIGPGEQPPGYVVWDGQLSAAFQEIDVLLQQLYIVSETSPACFGDMKSGYAESGSALKRLMQAPLAKVNRMRLNLDPALKRALTIALEMEGVEEPSLSIAWNDGLPQDDREMSQIYTLLFQNGLISRETAIKRLFEFDEVSLQTELGKIEADTQKETSFIMGQGISNPNTSE